jgi:hypothetical protein
MKNRVAPAAVQDEGLLAHHNDRKQPESCSTMLYTKWNQG